MGNNLSIDAAYDEAYFSVKQFDEISQYLEQFTKKHNIELFEIELNQEKFFNWTITFNQLKEIFESNSIEQQALIKYFLNKKAKSTLKFSGYGFQPFSQLIQQHLCLYQIPEPLFTRLSQLPSIIRSLCSPMSPFTFFNFNTEVIMDFYKIPSDLEMEMKSQSLKGEKILLIDFKSGIRFFVVDRKENSSKLVGGSIIGESALLGLLPAFTCSSEPLNTLLKNSFTLGDNRNVDMLVGDIYGHEGKLLAEAMLASSFGKAQRMENEAAAWDKCRSLFTMFAINCAQISVLYAINNQVEEVVFVSGEMNKTAFLFLLQSAFMFFAKGQVKMFFIKNGQYISSLGNLLQNEQKEEIEKQLNINKMNKLEEEKLEIKNEKQICKDN